MGKTILGFLIPTNTKADSGFVKEKVKPENLMLAVQVLIKMDHS